MESTQQCTTEREFEFGGKLIWNGKKKEEWKMDRDGRRERSYRCRAMLIYLCSNSTDNKPTNFIFAFWSDFLRFHASVQSNHWKYTILTVVIYVAHSLRMILILTANVFTPYLHIVRACVCACVGESTRLICKFTIKKFIAVHKAMIAAEAEQPAKPFYKR